jgi:hypothetical protein
MKQKEFLDLLNEYAKEISDPNNLKEQEEYLRQLEREQQETGSNPFTHQIVVPKPVCIEISHNLILIKGFCFETSVIRDQSEKNEKESKKNKMVFVNVCESDKIAKLTEEVTKQGGKGKIFHAI